MKTVPYATDIQHTWVNVCPST